MKVHLKKTRRAYTCCLKSKMRLLIILWTSERREAIGEVAKVKDEFNTEATSQRAIIREERKQPSGVP